MSGESGYILSTETINQLQHEHKSLLKKLFQLKFIEQTLLSETNYAEEEEERALNILSAKRHLLFDNKNDPLLHLGEFCQSGRKAAQLEQKLLRRLTTVAEFILKMRIDLPETCQGTVGVATPSQTNLLELDKQRRKNLEKLAEMRAHRVELLKAAAELSLGPHVCNELENLFGKMRLNQIKSNLMHKYFINELATKSEDSLKAIKEVECYINKLLEEQVEKETEKTI